MSQTEKCIAELEIVLTDLRAQGMDTMCIMVATAQSLVNMAKSDPEIGLVTLDSTMAVLSAAAQAIRGKTAMSMAKAILGE